MQKKLGTDTIQYTMFNEYWQLIQNFYIVEDTDEYWESFMHACNDFCVKYRGKFSIDLVMAYVDSRERENASTRK